jgi:hypothetical protein
MGAHLELLKDIHLHASDFAKGYISYSGYALLMGNRFGPSDSLKTNPDDDALSALRKEEMKRNTPMKDLPGFQSPDFEKLVHRIEELTADGVREGFLVVAIIDIAEEAMHALADPAQVEIGERRRKEMIDDIRAQMEQDSPENRDWYLRNIETMEEFERANPNRNQEHQTEYEAWTKIVGPWLEQPRSLGCWQALTFRDMHPDED